MLCGTAQGQNVRRDGSAIAVVDALMMIMMGWEATRRYLCLGVFHILAMIGQFPMFFYSAGLWR